MQMARELSLQGNLGKLGRNPENMGYLAKNYVGRVLGEEQGSIQG